MSKLFDYIKIFNGTTDYTNFIIGTTFVDPHFSTYSNNSDEVNYNPYLFIVFENASTVDQDICIINTVPDNNHVEDWFDFIQIDNTKLTGNDLANLESQNNKVSMSTGLHYVIYKFANNTNINKILNNESYTDISLTNIINNSNYLYVKHILLPDFINTINIASFTNVNTLYIQKHIIDISNINYFYSARDNNLSKIIVDRENKTYSSYNNCLINKSNEIILGCKNSIIPTNIKRINSYAFSRCKDLEEIDLNNIEYLGAYSFFYCSELETVKLGNELNIINSYCFNNCSKLSNINLNNIIEIKSHAFSGCNLTNINITNATLIEQYAFSEISSLESIDMPNAKIIENGAFNRSGWNIIETLNIPSCLTNIGELAFGTFEHSLKTITVDPDNPVYEDGPDANTHLNYLVEKSTKKLILGCANSGMKVGTMNNVIPSDVLEIGKYAFRESWENLAEINLGDSIGTIGEYAFTNCNMFETLIIPTSVKKIYNTSFENCYKLKYIEVESLNTNYSSLGEDGNNNNCIIDINNNMLMKGCIQTDMQNIPSTVAKIYRRAFYNCFPKNNLIYIGTAITDLGEGNSSNTNPLDVTSGSTIIIAEGNTTYTCTCNCIIKNNNPNRIIKGITTSTIPVDPNITIIGYGAFKHCYHLDSNFEIPENIQRIESYAFQSCLELSGNVALKIPSSINYIGPYAFNGCIALQNVVFKNTETAPTIYSTTFDDEFIKKIIVPSSATLKYENKKLNNINKTWKEFFGNKLISYDEYINSLDPD